MYAISYFSYLSYTSDFSAAAYISDVSYSIPYVTHSSPSTSRCEVGRGILLR